MALVYDGTLAPDFRAAASHEQMGVPVSLSIVSPLVALTDLCWIVALGVCSGLLYDAIEFDVSGDVGRYVAHSVAVAMLYSVFAHAGRLYWAPNLLRIRWQVRRSITIWLLTFVFLASLVFILKIGAMFSRGEVLLFFTGGLVATVGVRFAVSQSCAYVISSGVLTPNQVVLVGSAEELAGNETLPLLGRYGYSVAASFAIPSEEGHVRVKAWLHDVVRSVREKKVDEVLVVLPWSRPDLIAQVESELRILPVPVKLVPDITASRVLKRPLFELGPTKAIELQRAPLSATQRCLKRLIDQVLAAAGLFILAPFIAVIAAAIRLESSGPALFLQTRAGFNGRPFKIFKFRTMNACDDGPVVVQATKDDQRLTQLGALLRKLSIDELPQLLNVLRGDMSLVGPRPHALAHDNEYDRLIATYAIRHKMKPGITGWAQVNGYRGETRELSMMQQRVQSDLWYIEYWSIWLDVRILFLTVVQVWKTENAY